MQTLPTMCLETLANTPWRGAGQRVGGRGWAVARVEPGSRQRPGQVRSGRGWASLAQAPPPQLSSHAWRTHTEGV